MSFENLMLVVGNYIKHGFQNIIISDLNDIRMLDIPVALQDAEYCIFTLYSEDDDTIQERILSRNDENTYKDWQTALRINQMIRARPLLPNEYRICIDNRNVHDIAKELIAMSKSHKYVCSYELNEYQRSDFYSYT